MGVHALHVHAPSHITSLETSQALMPPHLGERPPCCTGASRGHVDHAQTQGSTPWIWTKLGREDRWGGDEMICATVTTIHNRYMVLAIHPTWPQKAYLVPLSDRYFN